MNPKDVEADDKRMAEEYGVYKAYAMVRNHLTQYKNSWNRRLNSDRLAHVRQSLDVLARLVSEDAMKRMGWFFTLWMRKSP